ncbi:MAG: hypothetical protein NTY17_12640 [Planctomycetia bacterium]|nr:hypothetical protein [Planctomycetia bacterium]
MLANSLIEEGTDGRFDLKIAPWRAAIVFLGEEPFEIVVDLQHRHHETEVGGDRLIEGEDLQALLFHLHLHAIDLFVVRHHSLGQIGIAVDERRDRLGDRLLHEGADSQDPLLEMFDLAFDVMGHGDAQPKRPVT